MDIEPCDRDSTSSRLLIEDLVAERFCPENHTAKEKDTEIKSADKTNSNLEKLQYSDTSCNEKKHEEKGNTKADSNLAKSIYSDDGHGREEKMVKSKRRPTKSQLAVMDTLALFGGSDLGSVKVKQRDLRDELKLESERIKSQAETGEDATERPLTKLQAAKQKAEAIFKDIPLGESIRKTVPSSFRRKRVRDGEEGSEMKRLSRLDKAKAETLEAFGGSTLESLSKRQKKQKIVHQAVPSRPPSHQLTRVERSRLDALQSFGGSGLADVMGKAKKYVARSIEVNTKETASCDTNKSQELKKKSNQENLINQVIT